MGLLHALLGLGNRSAQPLMHLSAVNPYLDSTLRSTPGGWSLPRQAAGLPCSALGRASSLATGVSSFAFQVCLHLTVTARHCMFLFRVHCSCEHGTPALMCGRPVLVAQCKGVLADQGVA